MTNLHQPGDGVVARLIAFCLENKLVVLLLTLLLMGAGFYTAPFDWDLGGLPRNPVGVDAIPDLGENQQIVFTEWPGRSPQDIEDQITYPLTTRLLNTRGANLFSLASGGAIYVRDPHHKLIDDQLNGALFADVSDDDWELIKPYLDNNEKHFGISVEHDLLVVDGVRRNPHEVYRKVMPRSAASVSDS